MVIHQFILVTTQCLSQSFHPTECLKATLRFTCSQGWRGDKRRVCSRRGNLSPRRRSQVRSVHSARLPCCPGNSAQMHSNNKHQNFSYYLLRMQTGHDTDVLILASVFSNHEFSFIWKCIVLA